MSRKRKTEVEREERLTRCDLVAALTAFAENQGQTLGNEREA